MKAVSQVLPLQQEEDHKDDDDTGRRQRLEQRPGELQDELERRRVGWAGSRGEPASAAECQAVRTAGPFVAGRPTFSRGLVISLPRSLSIVAARRTTPLLVVVSRSDWIFSVMLRPSLLCHFTRVTQHFFRLTDRRRGSRGDILNYSLGLTGRCGCGSSGALYPVADCLSGRCHARLQVSCTVRKGIVHHITPFDIFLPRELLPP
jgi:hypothetical protein